MSDEIEVEVRHKAKRGILLSLLLMIYMLASIKGMEIVTAIGAEDPGELGVYLMIVLITLVTNLVLTIATFQWRKWGLIGLYVMGGLGAVIFYYSTLPLYYYLAIIVFLSLICLFTFKKWKYFVM